ncbi:MAG: hypothetical protein E7455_06595 [Ruminococcaceae bacterium]|nr:hypothetical protein [Oscillospiraceae bacterium]
MWLVDLFMGFVDMILNIQFGKRFGWGSFLWDLAAVACLAVAVICFVADMVILGVIGIIGVVACSVMSSRRVWRDIRSKREQQKREEEKPSP